jgi:hypothetical protein
MTTYIYQRFGSTYAGGVVLPIALHPFSEGPGAVPSSMVELPGGNAWDYLQSNMARPRYELITHKGKVIAASAVALQTALDALYALRGRRDLLWKSNDGGTTTRWRLARVLDVRTEVGISGSYYGIVEMDFELAAGIWSGAAHTETTVIDAASHAVVTTNAGNATVRDAIVTVMAKVATITAVSLYVAGMLHWHYTGTIDINKALVVDCGSKTVKNDGADDYAHFVLQGDHAGADWLSLAAGVNTITVETTSTDHTAHEVKLEYADGWM